MSKENICPYCNGAEQIRIPANKPTMLDRHGKPMQDFRYYTCFCVNNRSISKKFNQLSGIPDITPSEALIAGRFAGFRNFLVFGPEMKFWHLVKATVVLHANYHRTFEILNGYDVIKRYYVEQPDGVQRSLDDLENRDLLIFSFDASMENRAQNKVVFEVIKRRIRMNNPEASKKGEKVNRPTWVYAPSKEDFKESKEYSSVIEELVEDFKVLDLTRYKVPFTVQGRPGKRAGINVNQGLGNI